MPSWTLPSALPAEPVEGLPASVVGRLQALLYDARAVAYLEIDDGLRLVGAGGRLDHYGLGEICLGGPAVEQVYFLEGLLPLVETPYFVPSVELPGGRATDLHFHRDADTVWVLLLDVTAERDATRRMQQKAHEMTLLQEHEALLNRQLKETVSAQSATIDVLKAMSGSPDDTQPVFELIARRAAELCGSRAVLWEFDGTLLHKRAVWDVEPRDARECQRLAPHAPDDRTAAGRAILERQIIHIRDIPADRARSNAAHDADGGSAIAIPLLSDAQPIGAIDLTGRPPGGFSSGQIAFLQAFAEQATIAITGVANARALRERTDDLARMVTELHALEEVVRAVNSSLDLDTVLATIISRAVSLSGSDEGTIYEFDEADAVFVPKATFGMSTERMAVLREGRLRLGETHLGRSALLRAPVSVDDVQQDLSIPQVHEALPGIHAVLAVPLLREDKVIGGLVIRRHTVQGFAPTVVTLMQTFAAQAVIAIENARLFQELALRGEEARRAHIAAETALADLRRAQARLVQSEKMASLGQLTAGIAHEIKNPLNFVNNFAGLSVELLDELKEVSVPVPAGHGEDKHAVIAELIEMLTGNLERVVEHGRRADGIVKSMLEHSRGSGGERRAVTINAVIEEALNHAYHGACARDQSFNVTLERDFADGIGPVELAPLDITRVLLNLFDNGFYAANMRRKEGAGPQFVPTLLVATRELGDAVEVRIRDNGVGIPLDTRDKVFQPFFTTKPPGEGTGLGLSISYDIVTQQFGGTITLDSRIGEFTEFTIRLPRTDQTAAAAGC
jgi:two-component system NtrC family sensor kinase